MSDTIIERIARALHHARVQRQHPKPERYSWETLSVRDQALLRVDARAVLAAIREPTAAMVKAADESDYECLESISMSQLDIDPAIPYRAMIDAALAEP